MAVASNHDTAVPQLPGSFLLKEIPGDSARAFLPLQVRTFRSFGKIEILDFWTTPVSITNNSHAMFSCAMLPAAG